MSRIVRRLSHFSSKGQCAYGQGIRVAAQDVAKIPTQMIPLVGTWRQTFAIQGQHLLRLDPTFGKITTEEVLFLRNVAIDATPRHILPVGSCVGPFATMKELRDYMVQKHGWLQHKYQDVQILGAEAVESFLSQRNLDWIDRKQLGLYVILFD